MRRLLLALVCLLVALLATAPASARVASVDASAITASRLADSRRRLNGEIVYYTYCFSLREPRLASGKSVVGLRLASDPSLRWKGRPLQHFGGVEVYDMRARQWVPELGSFLSIDEYAFHDARSTLWGWPGQNPIRYRDPSGRGDDSNPAVMVLVAIFGMGMAAPSDTSQAPANVLEMALAVPGAGPVT